MTKILITGANGQLGNDLISIFNHYPNYKIFPTDTHNCDITNYNELDKILSNKFDFIINCAAYTAVDKAETEKDKAFNINATAVKYLSELCLKYKSKLIHISTDYVFDGNKIQPYNENDSPNPLSVYGNSKLTGENHIFNINIPSVIIRTSWLYSSYGHNFIFSILRNAKEKQKLNVVFDQIGTPTYAYDLANVIVNIIQQEFPHKPQLFHFSNEGVTSWFDFAITITKFANIKTPVSPILTKDYPTPAKRPHNSIMDKTKIKNYYNINIPYWLDSVYICLNKILKNT